MKSLTSPILKAFAVLLFVLMACAPWTVVSDFIGIVAVPTLFLCVGYFFNPSSVQSPAGFVEKRFRQYYLPFLGWAVLFLLLHNLWFPIGLLSHNGLNPAHSYSWHEFSQRLWSIGLNMSDYDELFAAPFWILRALLVSSIGFMVLFILGRKMSRFENDKEVGWAIFVVSIALLLWQVLGGLQVTGVAGGGYRELVGLLFISIGFLFRQYRPTIDIDWRTYLLCLCVWVSVALFYPVTMIPKADILHFIALPIPAFAAYVLLLGAAELVGKNENMLTRALVYIGRHYLCILAFHLLAFKLVSMLVVSVYGIEWQRVAEFPTIQTGRWWDFTWLLYLVVGVGFPLLVRYIYERLTAGTQQSFGKWGDMLFDLLLFIVATILRILKAILLGFYHFFLHFFRALAEFLRASNPKDE